MGDNNLGEKNLFIAFEGMDGSGKDTQLHRLAKQIREDDNYPFGNKYSCVWLTREPTNLSEEGREISRKLRDSGMDKEEATKLYISDRVQHTKIIKNILNYSNVLTSRYDMSTLSYQMTQGMDFEDLYNRHKYNEEGGVIEPDITVVFLLGEEEAYRRTGQRGEEREFFEKREFQKELESNLLYCIDKLRGRGRCIITVDADKEIDEVTHEMFEKIAEVLNSGRN